MKPKTKNILLGVSLGLNILLGLLVGGALIKACADKPAENASSGLSLSSSVKMHDRNEKKALEPKKATISDDAENLWSPRYRYDGRLMYVDDQENLVTASSAGFASSVCWSQPLNIIGVYYVDVDYYDGQAGAVALLNKTGQTWLATSQGGTSYNLTGEAFHFSRESFFFAVTDTMLTDNDGYVYLSVSSTSAQAVFPRVVYVDALQTAPEDVITFPADYNPLVMFGQVSDNALYGSIAVTGTAPQFLRKTITGVFRIDGAIYDALYIDFIQCKGMAYQANDGSVQTFPANLDDLIYYPQSMHARVFGGTTQVPLWAHRWGVTNSGTTYLVQSGYWLNGNRQTIAVLDYDANASNISSLYPTYNALDLLKVRTASSSSVPTIGGDGNADVFGLLGQGFSAVAGIMNIQILPYLTLGTLIFVPLVVLVILAILKVLNK